MKKLLILILSLIIGTISFAQETDTTYWHRDVDTNGRLITYYMCKTDAQFNNIFKAHVKKQLGIRYDWWEPNWNSIQSGWISVEGIGKNFPKIYKILNEDTNELNWDSYKYWWTIQNINDEYFVYLFKSINDTVYMTINCMNEFHEWMYTTEVLTIFESVL